MSVKCAQILEIVENIAPAKLAEDWDNIGLLLGGYDSEINRILLVLDVTEDTVEEAVDKKADLIISHHPLFFKPFKNLRWNDSKSILIRKLIKNDISVISAHTNLDSSPEGINNYLGRIFNLNDIQTLSAGYTEKLYKIAVFTPVDYLDNVKVALFKSGAGKIGNYQQCSYESGGKGQFLPVSGSRPFIGNEGSVEFVEEIKVEVMVEEAFLGK
ncbi:MAG: Nif3-like dinuclear metal center hexameric protein, partial [Eubacteriaceae bacterium]|nr:Nif3-like dinuclear metal center hexameric protein [Eubacteriaceae bacterium]